jgi:hypothetical protein
LKNSSALRQTGSAKAAIVKLSWTDILLKMSLGTGKDAILCYLFVLLIVKNRRARMKKGCRI